MRKLLLALALLAVGGVLSASCTARTNRGKAVLSQGQDTIPLPVSSRGIDPQTGQKLTDPDETRIDSIDAWTIPEAVEDSIDRANDKVPSETDRRLFFRFRDQVMGAGRTDLVGIHIDRPNLYRGASVDEVIITGEYSSMWWLEGQSRRGEVPGFDPLDMDPGFLSSLAARECIKCGDVRLCVVDPVCAR